MPDFILKDLTWQQVFMFYEHATAALNGVEVEYEIEPPPLKNVTKTDKGMVYNR